MSSRDDSIRRLRASRPRRRFARASGWALLALAIGSWGSGAFHLADLWSERSRANLHRFLGEIRPWPLQGRDWNWEIGFRWVADVFGDTAGEALGSTLALSVAAIVLAGASAFLFSLPAARNLAGPEPFAPSPRAPALLVRALARAVVLLVRAFLIFLRSIPEYVWAFLLLTLLGVGAWPAVLALAIHNTGILGKLFAEVTENMETGAPAATRAAGATRAQLVPIAIAPRNLNRWLLYVFYRWETCVREATVLGLLGFVSLGWYIQDARAGVRYDEMVGYVLLGSALILTGDFVSARVRSLIRRS